MRSDIEIIFRNILHRLILADPFFENSLHARRIIGWSDEHNGSGVHVELLEGRRDKPRSSSSPQI
jgi:hypothetical protein